MDKDKVIELAKHAGIEEEKPNRRVEYSCPWFSATFEDLGLFRALCVAERDKELIGVGMEPAIFFRCQNCKHEYMDSPPSSCDCFNYHYFYELNYYTAEQLAAARLQDRQRIAELEANLKRATAALEGITSQQQKRRLGNDRMD